MNLTQAHSSPLTAEPPVVSARLLLPGETARREAGRKPKDRLATQTRPRSRSLTKCRKLRGDLRRLRGVKHASTVLTGELVHLLPSCSVKMSSGTMTNDSTAVTPSFLYMTTSSTIWEAVTAFSVSRLIMSPAIFLAKLSFKSDFLVCTSFWPRKNAIIIFFFRLQPGLLAPLVMLLQYPKPLGYATIKFF